MHTRCHSPNTKNLTLSIYWEPIYDSHNSHYELFFYCFGCCCCYCCCCRSLWMCVQALTPIVNLTARDVNVNTFHCFRGKILSWLKFYSSVWHIKAHYKQWVRSLPFSIANIYTRILPAFVCQMTAMMTEWSGTELGIHPTHAVEQACNPCTCVNFISMHLSLYHSVISIFGRAELCCGSFFVRTKESDRKEEIVSSFVCVCARWFSRQASVSQLVSHPARLA